MVKAVQSLEKGICAEEVTRTYCISMGSEVTYEKNSDMRQHSLIIPDGPNHKWSLDFVSDYNLPL